MMSFKKGDRVIVTRASTEAEYHLWNDGWVPEMDAFIGEVCIVTHTGWDSTSCQLRRADKPKGSSWNFPMFVLRKEYIVGEQLLFEFMKDL